MTETELDIVEFRQTALGEFPPKEEWFDDNIKTMDQAEAFGRILLEVGERIQLTLGMLVHHVEKGKAGSGFKGGRRELARRLERPESTLRGWESSVIGKEIIENCAHVRAIPEELPIKHYEAIAKSQEPEKTVEFITETFEETGKLPTIRETKQEVQKQKQESQISIPLPEGQYNIICADPPWRYDFAETNNRAIENQYPTMGLEEIKEKHKELSERTATDAVLFLWATAPKLREALEVMKAWGFEYKTHAIWDKEIIGMGYWFRGQHELLLVGTKGDFSPPIEEVRSSSVIMKRRGKHSKKPDSVYELIERMFPNTEQREIKRLEMFARNPRQGWTVWGDEIG